MAAYAYPPKNVQLWQEIIDSGETPQHDEHYDNLIQAALEKVGLAQVFFTNKFGKQEIRYVRVAEVEVVTI